MKFLMVLNDMDWFWSHRLPLARAIQEAGWDLHLAAHGADRDEKLKSMAVTGWNLPRHGRGGNVLQELRLMVGLFQAIRKSRPDLIHAITIRYAFYTGLVMRLIGGRKPVIFTIAGLGSLYTAPGLKMRAIRSLVVPLMRLAFNGRNRFIIFQNPDDQSVMVNAGIVTAERTVVIRGSGVDINDFAFCPYEEEEDAQSPPIILFPSRLVKEKGIEDFIEAARILKKQGVVARFAVAGKTYPDNSRSMTEPEMNKASAEGAIEWLGQVTDMPALLRRCMMVVLPSYYGEGVPKVLLEAAATGRPIITCDAPGCREAVQHDGNGLLVPPRQPQALAESILALMQDASLRARYAAAGRARMEDDFNTTRVVSQTMAVYDSCLKTQE